MFRTTRRQPYAQSLFGNRGGGGLGIRLIIGLVIAAFSIISFLMSREHNPVTGEDQYLSLTPEQEIALGLQSAPELINEFGGLYPDQQLQDAVDQIGTDLVRGISLDTPDWQFEFYVLDDPNTVNAFALPGGPVFITTALINAIEQDSQSSGFSAEDMVAGVLSHEIVHVLARHSAQQIAKSDLAGGLVGAVGVASGNASAAQTAAMVAQMVTMSYGREAEIQSDTLGVCLMIDAGYDPNAMTEVMRVLQAASGGSSQPEFASTHPNPENRIARIEEAIANSANCNI